MSLHTDPDQTAGRASPLPPGALETLKIVLPRRFAFLLELHPYKVAKGGRYGLKSWSYADAILALGANQRLRIVCGREVMESLSDSCHKLLSDRISALGLSSFYTILQNEIRGRNGTTISYAGLSTQTADSIKSFEGVDIFWAEEAQSISEHSWRILLPTIRAERSEVWISFNPNMDSDPTYKRWVENPPPGTVVVTSDYNYAKACGFFTEKMEALRLHDQKTMPDEDYKNIWEGEPRTSVVGAIYAKEIREMVSSGRICKVAYDPKFPVQRVWDLGWNDAMSIIMVQKVSPTTLCVINYIEDSFKRYDELIGDMNKLRYRWGTDYLPHDGKHHDPKSGTSAENLLKGMGCKVHVAEQVVNAKENRIKAGRMLFPRIYIDNTDRPPLSDPPTGHHGGARLIECLKNYKRTVPKTTSEPSAPLHDWSSHGSDAYGALAEIAAQIKNDVETRPKPRVPVYSNSDPSMGMLG